MPHILMDVDRTEEDQRTQLLLGRPCEVHRQNDKKRDGDDEQGPPSPPRSFWGRLVRTYRQTR